MSTDRSPSASRPPRSRVLRRTALAACTLLLGGLLGFFAWRTEIRRELVDLERQFALAQQAGDYNAVGEIARRIAERDHSPQRLLAVSAGLLHARRFDVLAATLDRIERTSPRHAAEVLRLRARAAAAQQNWDVSIALWDDYLGQSALAPTDRIQALDEFAALLASCERWTIARHRIDERIELADATAARLVRAHIAIRQRDWAAAKADFLFLKTHAAAEPAVKETLPAWERVERSLHDLTAADAALTVAPRDCRLRLERALLCARLGLWQNAAEDLRLTAASCKTTRLPVVFGTTFGMTWSSDSLASLPWLAPTTVLAGFLERSEGNWPCWQRLAAIEDALAHTNSPDDTGVALVANQVERARILGVLGFSELALSEAQALLKTHPNLLSAHAVAVSALLQRSETAEAAAQLERALATSTETIATDEAPLQELVAQVRQAQGRHAEVVDALNVCLARESQRADLLRTRARSLRHLQRFTEAAQDLAAAERLETSATTEAAR